MHPSPATAVAALLVVAAAGLVVLAAASVRPVPRGPVVLTQAAPGAEPRVRGDEPSPVRRAPRREVALVAPRPEPPAVVKAYYRALDARRFEDAWTLLSPAVRSAFGGFERWRDGFATTLSSSPRDIEVAHEGAVVSLAHELVTEDRSSCGPLRRIFAVRWRLERSGDGWRAASVTGVQRAGPEPAGACP